MHIADILSRLAGKDLEPSDQLIPISSVVHTRSTRPLKEYYASKHKMSIPYKITTSKSASSKPSIQSIRPKHPPKIPTRPAKPTTISKTPKSVGILRKVLPTKPPHCKKNQESLWLIQIYKFLNLCHHWICHHLNLKIQ